MISPMHYALLVIIAIFGWALSALTAGRVLVHYERDNWWTAATFYFSATNAILLAINGFVSLLWRRS
jgi:uncharacterized membrane protein (DUF106 family)